MSMKTLLCATGILLMALPAQANDLAMLQQNPDQARGFDYCSWAFDDGGKAVSLPDYHAMLDRETTTLPTAEWAATALVEAGTHIAQNAETKTACEDIFVTGEKKLRSPA